MKKRSLQSGMTLIEFMVTIIVLAVVTVLAVPTFATIVNQQNLNKSVDELIRILNQARSTAVLERRAVTVHIGSLPGDDPHILHWQPSGNAILTSAHTTLTFMPNGLLQASTDQAGKVSAVSRSFVICDHVVAQRSKTVSISRMGVIQHVVEGKCR